MIRTFGCLRWRFFPIKYSSSFLLIGVFLFPLLGLASGLEGVMISPSKIPAGWGTPYSNYSVSDRATVFFDNYESIFATQTQVPLVEKKHQSFSGAGRGTVFYLELASPNIKGVEDFAKKFIWEGPTPSAAHPEKIFSIGSVLVIVSFPNEGIAEKVEELIKK